MRNIILGTVAGLILGTVGALAYSHFLGDGQMLADLQAQLDAAKAALAKAEQDKKQLTQETSGVSDQIDALQKSNDDLKKQLADAGQTAAPTAPPAINPLALAGMMMGARGAFQTQQQLLLLKTRLHLTPDQEAKIKAAMEADAQARRGLMQQMFRNNGKVDPQAAAKANTLPQVLAGVLTPDQQAQYQQVQADEQASRADTAATVQINQVAPLLQLTDSQKDQVFNALYQVQMSTPDPTTMMTNPMSAAAAQSQATNAALAKVLTPDQMALYQQEAAAVPTFGGGGGFGRRGGGGGGGGGNGGGGGGGGNGGGGGGGGGGGNGGGGGGNGAGGGGGGNGGGAAIPSSTGAVNGYTTITPPVINSDGTATSATLIHNPDGTIASGSSVTGFVASPQPSTTPAPPPDGTMTNAPASTTNASSNQ